MTRASERWDEVGTYDNPAGWVYRVALNWARSWYRRRRRVGPEVVEAMWDKLPDPDVNEAVAALSYHHRSVIVARFYLDWSTPQIADGLDLPLGTVKSRLHRALASLEETLGGDL